MGIETSLLIFHIFNVLLQVAVSAMDISTIKEGSADREGGVENGKTLLFLFFLNVC